MEVKNIKSLLELPPELLLNIFRYINVRHLFGKVILTCKYFHEILTADGIWQTLFALKWKQRKCIDDVDYVSSWGEFYMSFEDIDMFWMSGREKLVKHKLSGHIGTVDALHIMPSKQVFISGSRDRTALVWKVKDYLESDFEQTPQTPEVLQHSGWVWAIGSDVNKPNEVVTTSWDKKVKHWDLETLDLLNTYHYHPSPILCLCYEEQVLTTGCYDKIVRRFDMRSGEVVLEVSAHKRSVLSLQINDNYMFSGSEDRNIAIFDLRAGKILTKLAIDSPALCMNTGSEQGLGYLRVGGKNGSMYVYDISNGSRFTMLNTFDLWSEQKKVTDICNFRGGMMACSEGGSVRAYTPDRSCTFIKKFDDVHNQMGVTSCCSHGDLMLTGGEDCSVFVWKFLDD